MKLLNLLWREPCLNLPTWEERDLCRQIPPETPPSALRECPHRTRVLRGPKSTQEPPPPFPGVGCQILMQLYQQLLTDWTAMTQHFLWFFAPFFSESSPWSLRADQGRVFIKMNRRRKMMMKITMYHLHWQHSIKVQSELLENWNTWRLGGNSKRPWDHMMSKMW